MILGEMLNLLKSRRWAILVTSPGSPEGKSERQVLPTGKLGFSLYVEGEMSRYADLH